MKNVLCTYKRRNPECQVFGIDVECINAVDAIENIWHPPPIVVALFAEVSIHGVESMHLL
jgi:hypothetical protein